MDIITDWECVDKEKWGAHVIYRLEGYKRKGFCVTMLGNRRTSNMFHMDYAPLLESNDETIANCRRLMLEYMEAYGKDTVDL